MRLLVAYDGSEGAGAALREAAVIARETGAPVVVAQVVQPLIDAAHVVAPTTAEAMKQVTAEVQAGLDAAIAEAGISGAQALVVVAERGEDDAEALERVAEEQAATMVVISSRRVSSVRGALLGSVTGHVVRHAPCPVLVVRE